MDSLTLLPERFECWLVLDAAGHWVASFRYEEDAVDWLTLHEPEGGVRLVCTEPACAWCAEGMQCPACAGW